MGMEFLLLPAVTVLTPPLERTAFLVGHDEGATFPVRTHVSIVVENVGFAAEILPVVRVHALRFIVIFGERTPRCFEMKQVEIHIFRVH